MLLQAFLLFWNNIYDNTSIKLLIFNVFRQKQSFADVFENRRSLKFHNIHRKTPVLESLFNKVSCLQACGSFGGVFEIWSDFFFLLITVSIVVDELGLKDIIKLLIDCSAEKSIIKNTTIFFIYLVAFVLYFFLPSTVMDGLN